MKTHKSEELAKLVELNKEFLRLIENGKSWEELRDIREQMKELAKNLDHAPATVIDFDNYSLDNKMHSGTKG